MNLEVDVERVLLAQKAVRAELLAERMPRGHWVGHVASSPFATAAAISALVAAHRPATEDVFRDRDTNNGQIAQLVQGDLSELFVESLHWLARHQNPDGGWGDCDSSQSNIAATMLVQAAFRLTGVPAKYSDLILRADQYVDKQGGVAGLRRRYSKDKTLLASILTSCALAGMVPWRQVPTLPFELACLPKAWQAHVQPPVARYAKPVFVAVGWAKFHHDPPRNPIMRLVRRSRRAKSLTVLEQWQAADDSFLASIPLTAFVVMSLAGADCQDHSIVRRGVEFLLASVRGDASWPSETNRATTLTVLALHAAAAEADPTAMPFSESSFDWLLECQRAQPNSLTGVPAGGWARSEAAGALPNTIDTAAGLVALAGCPRGDEHFNRDRIQRAAQLGVAWLLDLHNDDGGWPTYYRDTSSLHFEESGPDATAHALRALGAWQRQWQKTAGDPLIEYGKLAERIGPAIERGWRYLESKQRADGSFIPRWFGNEHQPGEANPVYGTAQVLIASAELDRLETEPARRAARWMLSAQHAGGGWGPPRAPLDYSNAEKDGFRAWRANEGMSKLCSVEETALAVTALLPLADSSQPFSKAVSGGLTWLANAVEQDAHRRPAVIGFSLPKLWYHERLYPLVFAEWALGQAERRIASERLAAAPVG